MKENIEIRESKKHGKGLFALKDFKKGETVYSYPEGKFLSSGEIDGLSKREKVYLDKIGENEYEIVAPPGRYVNHSCKPNAIERDRIGYAIMDIEKGEEILIDYDKLYLNEPFKCHCGFKECRGIIRGEKNKNATADNNYCTIYLIRHGETDWNLERRIQGRNPIPLNQTGRLQSAAIASILKNAKIAAIYSSDIQRTIETAKIIAVEHNLTVQLTKLMRERRYGALVGHDKYSLPEKLRRRLDSYYSIKSTEARWKHRPIFRHESNLDIEIRTLRFLREIAISHAGKNVVVVTHGVVIMIILAALGWVSKEEFYKLKVPNAAYAVIQSDSVDFIVKDMHGITK